MLWVEPVLTTRARNGQASALIEAGSMDEHPFWTMGLNGSGVIVGVADSRIDADAYAFETLRVQRAPTQENASTLRSACLAMTIRKSSTSTAVWTGTTPWSQTIDTEPMSSGPLRVTTHQRTPERASRQQLDRPTEPNWWCKTSSHPTDGCLPNVDALLWESSAHGGVIHSNSWGDDTTAYTERTADSTPTLEPFPGRWPSLLRATAGKVSSNRQRAKRRRRQCEHQIARCRTLGSCLRAHRSGHGRYFRARPRGQLILSAGADGFWDTNNENLRTSSGSSMATPHAAGAAAVVQQLYQDGWIAHENDVLTNRYLSDIKPAWADPAPMFRGVELGEGFTPSGSLLRASLALAATPLPETVRNGGTGGHDLHNPYDGWGVLNLSQLMDPRCCCARR